MLAARGVTLTGASVLDLFAGTGSLGLEALSRGAARATFVESAGPALAALERNLAALGLAGDRAEVLRGDWRRALDRLAARGAAFRLVLLDPPYGEGLAAAAVERLAASAILASGAIVVAEHAASEPIPGEVGGLETVVRRAHGRTAVSLLRKPAPERE